MLVKSFWKAALVLAVVMILAPAALAASSNSGLVRGKSPSGDTELQREIKGGITVQYVKMNMSSRYKGSLCVTYMVTSETDQVINVERKGADLFNNAGHQWTIGDVYADGMTRIGVHIGADATYSREIIGGVPTEVWMYYKVGDRYEIDETYPRITFIINGERLVFRNVPSNH